MLVFRNILKEKIEYPIENICDLDKTLFFDIETTGFSRKHCKVYLIGCMYYMSGSYHCIQWFAENFNDEANVLMAFYKFIKGYNTLIHFNGNSFDIPFVKARGLEYNIDFDFDKYKSIDLYKEVYPIRKIFKLENNKQKTFEKFLEIKRDDPFSGGDLIHVFKQYVESKDDKLILVLLLHNKEDVCNMGKLCSLLSYSDIKNHKYSNVRFIQRDFNSLDNNTHSEVQIKAKLTNSVLKPVSFSKDNIYIIANEDELNVSIMIQYGTLRLFFDNYSDYYYLPEEDRAIHKSVSSFVDPKHRVKANSKNCYDKVTGAFLPYFRDDLDVLKIEKNDKSGYIRLEDLNSENVNQYLDMVIDSILEISTTPERRGLL